MKLFFLPKISPSLYHTVQSSDISRAEFTIARLHDCLRLVLSDFLVSHRGSRKLIIGFSFLFVAGKTVNKCFLVPGEYANKQRSGQRAAFRSFHCVCMRCVTPRNRVCVITANCKAMSISFCRLGAFNV